MAYDEGLFARVLDALGDEDGATHKKMFGGVCFLVRGNMACGIIGNGLIVRVGPDAYAEAMARPHTRVFDFTHRPMAGWVVVDAAGLSAPAALADWVARGVAYARSLPAK